MPSVRARQLPDPFTALVVGDQRLSLGQGQAPLDAAQLGGCAGVATSASCAASNAHALDATDRRHIVGISSAYRKPETCRQHQAALTGGVPYSGPASVNLYLVSLLPLAAISIGWRSLRIAGPHAAWA
jgi:hypothetical protein